MASYICPKCGEPVKKGGSTGARMAGGVAGLLLYSAFGSYVCPKCGKIPKSEFPAGDQARMTKETIGFAAGGIGLIVVVLILLFAVNSW